MRIALGADHGGYELKNQVLAWLQDAGHEVMDLGAHTYERTDQPKGKFFHYDWVGDKQQHEA